MGKSRKKVLFVATVDSHIELFHLPYLKMFKDKGYEVHVATNTNKPIKYCDKKIKLSIERNPFKLHNLKAIRELKKVLKTEKYDIIHCHTPMGGVVARLAAKKARKAGTRVIYTAHGFHFYKGAPKKNWILFYPVEKYLAKFTDTLITINSEDYNLAKKKFGKRCNDIHYVPGVGVDEKKFKKKLTPKQKHELRKSLGLKDDDFVMIFPAELSKRKNQLWLINQLAKMLDRDDNIKLLLPGSDSMNCECQRLAWKLGIERQVIFLGFRSDVIELFQISDLAISSSKQEGLPVNLIEAASVGLPIIATNCRGNRDVVKNVNDGVVTNPENFARYIYAYKNGKLKTKKNNKKSYYKFLTNYVLCEYERIYGFGDAKILSIIIPAFNAEKYINKCIESIESSSSKNIKTEIIIIDDGSTDNTLKISKSISKKYDNVTVLSQKNSGVSIARSNGIKVSSGDYLFFVDSDDTITTDCIEQIQKRIISGPDFVTKTPFIHKNTDFSLHTNIFRKEFIIKNNIKFDDKLDYTEDMDYVLKAYKLANSVTRIDGHFYNYNKNNNSVTKKNSYKRIKDLALFINRWTSEIDNMPIKDFLFYQELILCGLVKNLEMSDEKKNDIENYIKKFGSGKSFKTLVGVVVYHVFGYNVFMAIMGMRIKQRGVK